MAGGSLLSLLDNIATTMDDVALMTKVAAKKTAGVLGDDLALNAEQCSGKNISAERELPIVRAVAMGSFVNKLILIPIALLLSNFAPWLINPLLLCGGLFLCFEGAEKVLLPLLGKEHGDEASDDELPVTDLKEFERQKVKGAVKTDFVLSSEIIIITLGTVANSPILERLIVLSTIGVVMTVGVYGLVGVIVKLDDFGLYLVNKSKKGTFVSHLGRLFVDASPVIMKVLTLVGTVAMFTVGGSLIAHNLPVIHELFASITLNNVAPGFAKSAFEILKEILLGFVSGGVLLLFAEAFLGIKKRLIR